MWMIQFYVLLDVCQPPHVFSVFSPSKSMHDTYIPIHLKQSRKNNSRSLLHVNTDGRKFQNILNNEQMPNFFQKCLLFDRDNAAV